MFVDYYVVLAIPFDASESEIKNAFKKQAMKWHPDRNKGIDTTSQMQLINEAYLILKDKEARVKYDKEYLRFKSFQSKHKKEDHQSNASFEVKDEVLKKWMRNAKRQAIDLAKHTIDEFKNIGYTGVKGATKGTVEQFGAQVLITIFAVLIFSAVGICG